MQSKERSAPQESSSNSPERPGRPLSVESDRPEGDDARRAALISTIEGEIVPRLLMLSRSADGDGSSPHPLASETDDEDVDELARLLLVHGPELAREYVEVVHQRGIPYERICVDLLAEVARRLAQRWECLDLCYPDVTHGLGALHAVVLEVSGAARNHRRMARGD